MEHYIIGQKLENGEFLKGESDQGVIYKNSKAFYDKTNEVCYIPEMHDEHYIYEDFLDLCNGSFEVASMIFDTVDWQTPNTYLEDCLSIDEVAECSDCKKMFLSYEVDNCPYCNHPKK